MAEIAEVLGTPLMPWQRLVADVALEVDPDTGLLAYREVRVTVPRQSGKTTLTLSTMVHRALGFGTRQRIIYTAQTRGAARRKWEDEHVAALESSPFRKLFSVRKQLGQEAIRWKNGSMHGIESNTEKAAHGETVDLGVIDEAFSQEDARLEQAFKPAMITRPQPQLWVVSTAGTAKSAFLRAKVDDGRERARMRQFGAVAYFEWSAPGAGDPEGAADPEDPATWRGCMPALGHTVTEAAIRAEFESMDLAEFRRAFLNQWPDDAPEEWLVIGEKPWRALADPESEIVGPLALCADVTPDRSAGSIAVAGLRADGLAHVEVIDARPGTSWMVSRIVDLVERWSPCAVVLDVAGPAGSLLPGLEKAGVEVVKPSAREVGQACGALYDMVMPPRDAEDWKPGLRHLDQPELSSALAGAQRRSLGDAWAWARKGLSVDISPLVAATMALWGHAKFGHVVKASKGSRPKLAYL
ncbi:MAG TPA: terminase large subunit [Armatimonadota bacterium]|nr:terminase large subunit [Armatimonadota bacterium]